MKIAIVHDWLFHMRGGEKVLEAIAELYPNATVYTLFFDRKGLSPSLARMRIKTSFMQYLPGIRKYYRYLLPVLPWIIRTLKIEPDTQLVLSSSHCVAKGVSIPEKAFHVCYCHTPMRYIWGFEKEYFSNIPGFLKPLLNLLTSRLRIWDVSVNTSVHHFIANSENVRKRIALYYEREATVIYPPLDAKFYEPGGQAQDYYLVVSAFVPYKKVDLVIEAFNSLDRKLIIVGSGPMKEKYEKLRKSEKIIFLGSVPSPELKKLFAQARALLFPTDEDFGIVPLEAQSAGTPVIAYGKGGALESVKAGVFFDEQTPEAIRAAVMDFEQKNFDRAKIPQLVSSFDKAQFKEKYQTLVNQLLAEKNDYAVR